MWVGAAVVDMVAQPAAPSSTSSPTPSLPAGDPTWWKFIGIVGVILGILAAVQQLTALGNRRRQRAQDRLFEVVERQLDAEQAEQDAQRYEHLRRQLRGQIDSELPREARRVFLLNRRELLARTIADDYVELQAIEQELGDQSGATTALDQRVRAVVQTTIVPTQELRRRRERTIFLLLALLVIITLLPINIGYWLIEQVLVLTEPPEHHVGEVVLSCILATVLLTAIALGSLGLLARAGVVISPPNRTMSLLVVATTAVGLALLAWGFAARNWALVGTSYYSIDFSPDEDQYYRSVVGLQAGVVWLSAGLTLLFLKARPKLKL